MLGWIGDLSAVGRLLVLLLLGVVVLGLIAAIWR